MSGLDAYIEFVREKMRLLSDFPRISVLIYNAVKQALEKYNVRGEVYFFGSIIEGRYTASSDIDVAILVEKVPEERREIVREIMRGLEGKGLPFWLPLEIHFFTPSLFSALKRGGTNFIKAEDYIQNSL
ncbi:nucleotidyltransferase domain-containing protein [Thermoproteus tenax]|uniref:Minimal nucleotidyltransferase family protein n=1 Tax=Thermoproteus tenax (strain ATCC 35583 / DSM 2078 / JCM 9277 / NBRC 100435 / Kra 1) TaxID=768679 RepID=G4RJJ5_THETK|nr:nucleotidyltransferase domain-containing protein [Thermoproteus tenax]CCC81740.1 minimal nucleotidyltransferase family protein [Thermoproteus tenax Kra 1]